MKRFWHTWLAVVAASTMVGTANAQQNWNQSNEIGSYQSILARSGYNNAQGTTVVPNIPNQGGMVNGQVVGQPMAGQPAMGQPMMGQPMMGQPMMGQPVGGGCDGGCGGACNGGCGGNGGYAGNGAFGPGAMANGNGASSCGGGGGYVDSGYVDGGHYDGGYDGGVYGRSGGMARGMNNRFSGMGLGNRAGGSNANYVFGASALFFRRSHEDDVRLTRNAAGDVLTSTDADMGTMGGVQFGLTKRNCNGTGLQFLYWGLFPGQQDATIAGPGLDTYLTGLNGLAVAPGAQNLLNYYNNSDTNRIYRDNEFHNAEINMLRNGGNYTTRGGRAGNFEMLGGARWFQFNEDFRYSAFYASANPNQVDYEVNTRNTLLGLQLGGINNLCLSDRMTLVTGTRVGVFNNHASSDQCICDSNGVFAYRTASGVDDYNFMASSNSLAMLGELDLGLAYRLTSNCRATVGYRVLGINGVALAPSQIPRNFANDAEINEVKTNDSLILGGGYAGLEFCF